MKLTAPMAIPTPNTMPASSRLDPPSPNANVTPPTTIETRLRPRAIGPVKLVIKTLTAFSHGEACAYVAVGISTRVATANASTRPQRDHRTYARQGAKRSACVIPAPFFNEIRRSAASPARGAPLRSDPHTRSDIRDWVAET